MQTPAPRRSLRLIHTSDLHLGCDYLGDLPQLALAAVVAVARGSGADALLLPGDLFDHNRAPDAEIERFLDQLSLFDGPIVILPGNHDCFDETSVYRRPIFKQRPAHIHLLTGDGDGRLVLPDLDLDIWGKPVVEHNRAFRPLLGAPTTWQASWRLVLGHGQFELPGSRDLRSSPIFPEDIAAANCDYVALGHWDLCSDVSQGDVTAFYSGAPHYADRRAGLSSLLQVDLDAEQGVQVRRRILG